jgi:hypothetical protein
MIKQTRNPSFIISCSAMEYSPGRIFLDILTKKVFENVGYLKTLEKTHTSL